MNQQSNRSLILYRENILYMLSSRWINDLIIGNYILENSNISVKERESNTKKTTMWMDEMIGVKHCKERETKQEKTLYTYLLLPSIILYCCECVFLKLIYKKKWKQNWMRVIETWFLPLKKYIFLCISLSSYPKVLNDACKDSDYLLKPFVFDWINAIIPFFWYSDLPCLLWFC